MIDIKTWATIVLTSYTVIYVQVATPVGVANLKKKTDERRKLNAGWAHANTRPKEGMCPDRNFFLNVVSVKKEPITKNEIYVINYKKKKLTGI